MAGRDRRLAKMPYPTLPTRTAQEVKKGGEVGHYV